MQAPWCVPLFKKLVFLCVARVDQENLKRLIVDNLSIGNEHGRESWF